MGLSDGGMAGCDNGHLGSTLLYDNGGPTISSICTACYSAMMVGTVLR